MTDLWMEIDEMPEGRVKEEALWKAINSVINWALNRYGIPADIQDDARQMCLLRSMKCLEKRDDDMVIEQFVGYLYTSIKGEVLNFIKRSKKKFYSDDPDELAAKAFLTKSDGSPIEEIGSYKDKYFEDEPFDSKYYIGSDL